MSDVYLIMNTRAFGILMALSCVARPVGAVTFNKDIAPIVFTRCAVCHRAGEVGPFSLRNYEEVKRHSKQIVAVTEKRVMPPWKSVAGHGSFVGERRLRDEEIDLIARWTKEGAPEGAAADLPALPKFVDGWKLGTPDVIVTMVAPYEIYAEGPDIYRNFVFKFEVPKGKYIKAAEYRPSNRSVVHHAVLAEDPTGKERLQQTDPALGYQGSTRIPGRLLPGSMATWTPGRDAMPLAEGLSMPWRGGSDFVLQLHLHASGKPEKEQSSIGFYFTDQPPQRSLVDLVMIDKKIDITPGDATYRTRDELTLPVDVETQGIFPHMHLLGKDIKVTAYPPGGDPFSLLWINDWDFNWQSFYQFTAPMKLAAGTRVVMEGLHDNSTANPRNPSNPPKRVTWGEETANEMTVAILEFIPANESDLGKFTSAMRGRVLSAIRGAPATSEKPNQ
jgi:hypothetical protein